jgi:hypothetical protein
MLLPSNIPSAQELREGMQLIAWTGVILGAPLAGGSFRFLSVACQSSHGPKYRSTPRAFLAHRPVACAKRGKSSYGFSGFARGGFVVV